MTPPSLTVIGSVNLDLVATGERLPAPGETVTGARLARHPGGKGANQALAARRLGAEVRLVGRVGADAAADEALALLRADGVDLSGVAVDAVQPTGVALIAVDARGENQIVVAPGANAAFGPEPAQRIAGPIALQLELPIAAVAAAIERADGFVALNLAPALPVPDVVLRRADLLIANAQEAAAYGAALHDGDALVAITYGARGAALFRNGREIARASPPAVTAVDTTGAGDAFAGALIVALLEGRKPAAALRFACAAGALAAVRPGAQPSLPRRVEVDAILATSPA